MSKKDKQEVTNRAFNISNISKASSNFKKEASVSENVPIRFKVHKDLIETFHLLKMDYAKAHKNFALSSNEMLEIMVLFMESKYIEENILQNCPESFKKAIIKPGRRKTTKRTVSFPYSDSIQFLVQEQIADKYMDIMFSFISDDPNDDVFNRHHSRTYFFYDFIEFIKDHKKEFIIYSIN